MIHELRVYRAAPGRMPDLLNRFETLTLGIWERFGIRQAGFWTTAIGGDNHDLTYLIEWESLAEREEKWTAFATDPEWVNGKARTEENGPLVIELTNTILQPTKFSNHK